MKPKPKPKPNYNSHQWRDLKVFVFRNLHQDGVVWSVRDAKGHTILHTQNILIEDAKFIVQKGGQARVRLTRQKEVHAGIRGNIVVDPMKMGVVKTMCENGCRAFYNPYQNDTFVDVGGNALETAKFVYLTSSSDGKSQVLFLGEAL